MVERFEETLENVDHSVSSLTAIYNIYECLFESGQRVLDLLKETDDFCFFAIWSSLADAVLMWITRLCDPPAQGKYRNLVLQSLIEELPAEHTAIRGALNSQFNDIQQKVEPIREHRHKRLAHADRETAFGRYTVPKLKKSEVRDVMEAIWTFMNTINRVMDGEKMYGPVARADGLLFALDSAKELSELSEMAFTDPERVIRKLKGIEQPLENES